MKAALHAVALCGVLGIGATLAQAESVFVQLQDREVGRGVVVSLSGGLTFADGTSSRTVWAGQRSLLIQGQVARSFSAELTSTNQDGWFMQGPVADVLGSAKASAIGALFADVPAPINRDQAATFQAMLWEIVYDFDGSEQSIDMRSGRIAFSLLDEALFDSMKSSALRGGRPAHVELLGTPEANDQFRIVPLPPAATLAGAGLLAMGIRRRRTG